jgi:RimJ/RimL family protein N-acetyltransferase
LDDLDRLHALWTCPEVRRYLFDDTAISRERARELIDAHSAGVAEHGLGFWSLEYGGRLAGFCGFRIVADTGPDPEILYGLAFEFWHKGLATEACRAALDYYWAATDFARVLARADAPNAPSLAVMRRLGMKLESSGPPMVTCSLRRPPRLS